MVLFLGTGTVVSAQTAEPVDEEALPLYPEGTEEAPAEEAFPASGPALNIPVADYVKMVLVLAAVVGVIYLVFFFLKKGVRRRMPENDLIRILSSYYVQGNSMLFLVEVGTNVYLLSHGDGKLNLIAEITDKESIDTIRLAATAEAPPGKQNFTDLLAKFFRLPDRSGVGPTRREVARDSRRESGEPEGTGKAENPLDFIKRQRGRLQNLQ